MKRRQASSSSELATREFEDALDRATRGDRASLPVVRAFLDDHPDLVERVGDLSRNTERAIIESVAKSDLVTGEAIRLAAEKLKAGIAGEATESPLEKLLAQRIVLTWLQVSHADLAFTQNFSRLSAATKALYVATTQIFLKVADSLQEQGISFDDPAAMMENRRQMREAMRPVSPSRLYE